MRRHPTLTLILAVLVLSVPSRLSAWLRPAFSGKVVAIADGDTLTVLDYQHVQHKIKLYGIDAPEKAQPFGTKSREALASKVFGKEVLFSVEKHRDRYSREIGEIFIDNRDINTEMVADGCAWRYPQDDNAGNFLAAEKDAREHKRGLWADPHPIPPWEFRRAKREGRKLE
jgi:micrococcal nuclease